MPIPLRRLSAAMAPIPCLALATQLTHAAPRPSPPVPSGFTIADVKSAPFPQELTAAGTGSRIAWAFDEEGQRNLWVAEGSRFQARRLTSYTTDDGQELTSVSLSADGKYVVYVR